MKVRFLLLIISFFLCLSRVNSQTYKYYDTKNIHNQLCLNTKTGKLTQEQDDGQSYVVKYAETPDCIYEGRYELIPTQNYWNFILLDSFSGKLWQCQFSVESSSQIMSMPINNTSLSFTNRSKFYIKPMVSMYQFFLINGDTAERWKFQWSTKGDDYRWIQKVN